MYAIAWSLQVQKRLENRTPSTAENGSEQRIEGPRCGERMCVRERKKVAPSDLFFVILLMAFI